MPATISFQDLMDRPCPVTDDIPLEALALEPYQVMFEGWMLYLIIDWTGNPPIKR